MCASPETTVGGTHLGAQVTFARTRAVRTETGRVLRGERRTKVGAAAHTLEPARFTRATRTGERSLVVRNMGPTVRGSAAFPQKRRRSRDNERDGSSERRFTPACLLVRSLAHWLARSRSLWRVRTRQTRGARTAAACRLSLGRLFFRTRGSGARRQRTKRVYEGVYEAERAPTQM